MRKRQWFSKDEHPCILIKKGKRRYLIDTVTKEVVAHNFLPLLPLAMMAAPHVAKAVGGFIEKKLEPAEEVSRVPGIPTYRPRRMTSEERLVKLIQAEKMLR